MASNESFSRRERERAKKLKADAKRERRQNRPEPGDEPTDEVVTPQAVDQNAVIGQLAALNAAFDAGEMEFEDFDRHRAELLVKLTVD
jgi:hypothetical protein